MEGEGKQEEQLKHEKLVPEQITLQKLWSEMETEGNIKESEEELITQEELDLFRKQWD